MKFCEHITMNMDVDRFIVGKNLMTVSTCFFETVKLVKFTLWQLFFLKDKNTQVLMCRIILCIPKALKNTLDSAAGNIIYKEASIVLAALPIPMRVKPILPSINLPTSKRHNSTVYFIFWVWLLYISLLQILQIPLYGGPDR